MAARGQGGPERVYVMSAGRTQASGDFTERAGQAGLGSRYLAELPASDRIQTDAADMGSDWDNRCPMAGRDIEGVPGTLI